MVSDFVIWHSFVICHASFKVHVELTRHGTHSNLHLSIAIQSLFTFSQACEIVPYLHALGVSDVYASPYFHASPDSLHGYDIADHNKLNAAIGSRAEYDQWIA